MYSSTPNMYSSTPNLHGSFRKSFTCVGYMDNFAHEKNIFMGKDNLDWGAMKISSLFRKMFIPTLLGMMLACTMGIVDGVVVGQGVGSDALASVNIVAPFFLITTGFGLMFGTGGAIVASVYLSKGQKKNANVNITQAFISSLLVMVALSVLVMSFPDATAGILGSNDSLLPYVRDYMKWIIPSLPFGALLSVGLFIIRLDGSPIMAMLCNAIPAVINGILDYVFVFPLKMGIEGAAIATGLSHVLGAIMIAVYMAFFTKTLNIYKPKLTIRSIVAGLHDISYQIRLGAPSMIGELAIACMLITGNYAFMSYLGESGVAAFSVTCYCFPIIFMIGNAIAQSAQPIISYNYGAGLESRVRQTLKLSIAVGVFLGLLSISGGIFGNNEIASLFIPGDDSAHILALGGIPYFSISFLFFILNLVFIGYFQSVERFKVASAFMLLRGFILLIPSFLILPHIAGVKGLWLAVPLSESITTIAITLYYFIKRT